LLEDVLVLHARPYRESSQLVELLARDRGRTVAVIRGVRGGSRRRSGGPLEPFCRHAVELAGDGEVRTIRRAEPDRRFDLRRDHLLAGFYVNELLTRLLHRDAPVPELFDAVLATLGALEAGLDLEPVLRTFELGLLEALGHGLDLERDAHGSPLDPEAAYVYRPEAGWYRSEPDPDGSAAGRERAGAGTAAGQGGNATGEAPRGPEATGPVAGAAVLALARRDFAAADTRAVARRLLRREIDRLLEGRPLRSRALFRSRLRGEGPAPAPGYAPSPPRDEEGGGAVGEDREP
jgi:DNA repair protein RecO (recombination protein O)